MKTFVRAAALALAALPLAAGAQSATMMSRESQITVTGTGTISRPPDKASFNVNIVTTEDAAAASTTKNNAIYNELKAKLASAGIPEAAIKTLGFNVQFVPRPKNPGPNDFGQRYGYTTYRNLEVDTSVDGLGRAIDLAVAAGATDISNVSYGLRDHKGAYNQALAAAVADAHSQAEALAAAAGVKIVRLRYINAGGGIGPRPFMAAAPRGVMAMSAEAPVPTDIRPSGPIDVTATVTVTYEIQ